MRVELPGESKSFADINAGECFAVTRDQVTSVCMKVEWLSSASIAVLWSASDDWTVPHLIAPTELAGSIVHSLPSAVFVASSDAKDIRAGRTRNEYAPGFLIKTTTGQSLIAVKGLQREHGIPVIDVKTGEASGIETDNLTFFTSWRWSRHPNYFFEWLCWLAYPLIAIDLAGYSPYGWLALLAPACMYWALVYVSGIPPLEEHMLRSRGETFRAYQRRTRAFFPLPVIASK
jgi:uncharacterized protein DUF1295